MRGTSGFFPSADLSAILDIPNPHDIGLLNINHTTPAIGVSKHMLFCLLDYRKEVYRKFSLLQASNNNAKLHRSFSRDLLLSRLGYISDCLKILDEYRMYLELKLPVVKNEESSAAERSETWKAPFEHQTYGSGVQKTTTLDFSIHRHAEAQQVSLNYICYEPNDRGPAIHPDNNQRDSGEIDYDLDNTAPEILDFYSVWDGVCCSDLYFEYFCVVYNYASLQMQQVCYTIELLENSKIDGELDGLNFPCWFESKKYDDESTGGLYTLNAASLGKIATDFVLTTSEIESAVLLLNCQDREDLRSSSSNQQNSKATRPDKAFWENRLDDINNLRTLCRTAFSNFYFLKNSLVGNSFELVEFPCYFPKDAPTSEGSLELGKKKRLMFQKMRRTHTTRVISHDFIAMQEKKCEIVICMLDLDKIKLMSKCDMTGDQVRPCLRMNMDPKKKIFVALMHKLQRLSAELMIIKGSLEDRVSSDLDILSKECDVLLHSNKNGVVESVENLLDSFSNLSFDALQKGPPSVGSDQTGDYERINRNSFLDYHAGNGYKTWFSTTRKGGWFGGFGHHIKYCETLKHYATILQTCFFAMEEMFRWKKNTEFDHLEGRAYAYFKKGGPLGQMNALLSLKELLSESPLNSPITQTVSPCTSVQRGIKVMHLFSVLERILKCYATINKVDIYNSIETPVFHEMAMNLVTDSKLGPYVGSLSAADHEKLLKSSLNARYATKAEPMRTRQTRAVAISRTTRAVRKPREMASLLRSSREPSLRLKLLLLFNFLLGRLVLYFPRNRLDAQLKTKKQTDRVPRYVRDMLSSQEILDDLSSVCLIYYMYVGGGVSKLEQDIAKEEQEGLTVNSKKACQKPEPTSLTRQDQNTEDECSALEDIVRRLPLDTLKRALSRSRSVLVPLG